MYSLFCYCPSYFLQLAHVNLTFSPKNNCKQNFASFLLMTKFLWNKINIFQDSYTQADWIQFSKDFPSKSHHCLPVFLQVNEQDTSLRVKSLCEHLC